MWFVRLGCVGLVVLAEVRLYNFRYLPQVFSLWGIEWYPCFWPGDVHLEFLRRDPVWWTAVVTGCSGSDALNKTPCGGENACWVKAHFVKRCPQHRLRDLWVRNLSGGTESLERHVLRLSESPLWGESRIFFM